MDRDRVFCLLSKTFNRRFFENCLIMHRASQILGLTICFFNDYYDLGFLFVRIFIEGPIALGGKKGQQ